MTTIPDWVKKDYEKEKRVGEKVDRFYAKMRLIALKMFFSFWPFGLRKEKIETIHYTGSASLFKIGEIYVLVEDEWSISLFVPYRRFYLVRKCDKCGKLYTAEQLIERAQLYPLLKKEGPYYCPKCEKKITSSKEA